MQKVHSQINLMNDAKGERPGWRSTQILQEICQRAPLRELHHQAVLRRVLSIAQVTLVQAENSEDVGTPTLKHKTCFSLKSRHTSEQKDEHVALVDNSLCFFNQFLFFI